MSDDSSSRRRNWRHRENRARPKFLAKRVTEEDHEVVTAYAKSLNVTVGELLNPAVTELVTRARVHLSMTTVTPYEDGNYEPDSA
ncbi:uncharacterized protein RMCN_4822 [Mycolicibacterium novocastrense]|uniref:Uncharacterized protein n=1 Tax=Mycolicibacterium novocastrense TaxID=59813 RepID=A0ABQ0KRE1_MYCNV|nr:uncharacterized protein RMCN_4822 [Mycolicibacterium novocastrense]